MATRVSNVQTQLLIRHLQYSGAVADAALFFQRAMVEQTQSMNKLAESVRHLEARVDELERKLEAKS